MSESENVSQDKEDTVWEFIKNNPHIFGLPITEKRGIDLLGALKDIYEINKIDQHSAQQLLTLLATILVAATQGEGEEVIEEVMVQDAMLNFDKKIREVIDEGH